jgi:hypothetical protein
VIIQSGTIEPSIKKIAIWEIQSKTYITYYEPVHYKMGKIESSHQRKSQSSVNSFAVYRKTYENSIFSRTWVTVVCEKSSGFLLSEFIPVYIL